MSNILEILENGAADHPDRPLFAFLDARAVITQSYSYRQFHACTNHLADVLKHAGDIVRGEPVLLVYPPGLEFAAAFYAAAKIGALPVPVPPPASSNPQAGLTKLSHIVADSGARAVLTNERLKDRFQVPESGTNVDFSLLGARDLGALRWISTDGIDGELQDFERSDSEALFLQYTSGSTRAPKGVVVSHDNILHNATLALNHDRPVGVSWLPHFHDMGLIGYFLWSVVRGGCSYCISPLDFLRRPAVWLEAVTAFRATITTAPNFAFDYCLCEDKVPADALAQFDLSSLKQVVNAAEPVRAQSVSAFLERYAPSGLDPSAFTSAFGLAEHTLCVTGGGRVQIAVNKRLIERNEPRVETGSATSGRTMRLVSCGKPDPSVDLRIVNPETFLPKNHGEVGEIWVDSPSKAQGYWRQPEATAEQFHARIAGDSSPRGYLRTGDMGFVHDGELYVCGRLKDMIVVRGQNIYPNDIEAFVETEVPGVVAGSVAAFAVRSDGECEGVAVLIEAKGASGIPGLPEISREVSDVCQAPVRLTALVKRGSIVRTSSGKVSRAVTEENWRCGRIEVLDIHEPPPNEASERTPERFLQRILRSAERRGGDALTLEQLGLDSFDLVTLSVYLEEWLERSGLDRHRMAFEVNDLRIMQSITVGQLRQLAAEAAKPRPSLVKLGRLSSRAIREVVGEEEALIREDARLPDDIRPDPSREGVRGGDIFLTGVTGFLGSHLLRSLLNRMGCDIYVLVRAEDVDHGRNRLEAALDATGRGGERNGNGIPSRIKLLTGDLGRPRLGLNDAEWAHLSHAVSSIYHCGADVDYVKSYKAMRRANAMGTREILRLACSGPPKRLHHMSSTFVFGWCALPRLSERPYEDGMEDRDFGYAQTKWVSERLVYEAMSRGLDATVYRSSLITASRNDRFVRGDIVVRILSYMIRHQIAPDAANQLSFLPVDHCAENIAAISLMDGQGGATYHLTADDYYAMPHVCDIITEQFGYRFDAADMDGFARHIRNNCGPDDGLYPLKPFITRHVDRVNRMRDKRYDNRSYRSARRACSTAVPQPPLVEIVRAIVGFLQAEGMIPAMPTARCAGQDAVAFAEVPRS